MNLDLTLVARATLTGGERLQIVLHVDHETLKERTAGRGEFEYGPGVSAETCRRMACDCSYVKITENEKGEPLDVGRKTRSIPPALKRALNSRDNGCIFPGCTHKKFVDGHHVHHWAEGGETKLSNLVLLCRFHHRQVHEGGMCIERLDDGAWRFVRPDGESFASCAPGHTQPLSGDWTTLRTQNEARDIDIDAHTARTHWHGENMDHGLAIDVLLAKERGATSRGAARGLTTSQSLSGESTDGSGTPQPVRVPRHALRADSGSRTAGDDAKRIPRPVSGGRGEVHY